jgi:hypothetical protein
MDHDTRPHLPGPELPSLGGIALGTLLMMTGWMLVLTVIGIPFGIPMFAAGLGLLITPRRRRG